jgi:hypothetical protein
MPEDNTALSLESALSLMRAAPSADNSAAAQTEEKAPAAEAAPASQDTPATDEASTKDAPAAENKDTPADQGETPDETADPEDALPTIEPPSSWSTEEKAVWASLNRQAQEAIQRRDRADTKALRDAQNRSADAQKSVEAEVTKLKGLADKIGGYIQTEVKALARDFPEVRTEADVELLAAKDPARFSLFQARLMGFNAARQAETEAQSALQQKAEQQQKVHLESAKTALLEAFPTWSDGAVARKEISELQEYAISQGVPEQAARANLDPYVFKLAQKAMAYDKAQKAKADALTKTPPRTVKPGTQSSSPKSDAKAADRQSRLDRLSQSGDIEHARGLLRM